MTPDKQCTANVCHQIGVNEGYFGGPNSRPARNRNPGDLRGWPGYPQDAEMFTVFDSDLIGWMKLSEDFNNHCRSYPDHTFLDWIAGDGHGWPGYAPARDHNDPVSYAATLVRAAGCDANTKLGELK